MFNILYMRIAVLALQGAFIEHEKMLQRLGAETFEVRQLSDWYQTKDALVIPGGESTTQIRRNRTYFHYGYFCMPKRLWPSAWKFLL